jgi:ABC-type sugar transport system ATPase subunit
MLFKIIRDLKEKGITILYISHKMDEVFSLCERASVLRDGRYVTTLDLKKTSEQELVQNMIGRDVSMYAKRTRPSRVQPETVLKVVNLSGEAGFQNINFELKKGEILGFFGLVGAMRTEVMRAIFGADKALSGEVYHKGKKLQHRTPATVSEDGIGLISENRKEEGFVKTLDNADNIALASVKRYMRGAFISRRQRCENSVRIGQKVGLHPNDPEFMTVSLSGGNAQKVILAKWLSTTADILILDEPTKGIDIGAKAEIYKLMEDIVEEGRSIIMVSSELMEVMNMSDRIIVMREGHIVAELQRELFSEDGIITRAVGGTIHA